MKRSFLIYAASVVVGAAVAFAVLHLVRTDSRPVDVDMPGGSGTPVSVRGGDDPKEARIRHLLIEESPAMDERVGFRDAVDQLFGERRSPLRTRAFLKSRIQLMSRDQLVLAMMDGQVDTLSELREAARRLTLEDPQDTFTLFEKHQFRFRTMDRLYAFLDAHLQTWGDRDAPAVLARLKKMERGGSQQDCSLRFTDCLAKTNPALAARHFTDIIHLRNMDDFGKMVLNDGTYARKIADAWMRSDEPGMREYVAGLAAGREREAFEKAMTEAQASRK
jgi:hypothetical protein